MLDILFCIIVVMIDLLGSFRTIESRLWIRFRDTDNVSENYYNFTLTNRFHLIFSYDRLTFLRHDCRELANDDESIGWLLDFFLLFSAHN